MACNPAKYVGEGEVLVDRVKVRADVKHVDETQLKLHIKQNPNLRIFDIYRLKLRMYSLSGKKDTWLNKTLRSIGEAPVIFDNVLHANSIQGITDYMAMRGYQHAEVTATIDTVKRKRVKIEYRVKGNTPYRIGKLVNNVTNDTIKKIISSEAQASLLKEGRLFDIQKHDQERNRIAVLMNEQGYYDFTKSDIGFVVDTTLGDYFVNDSMVIMHHVDHTSDNFRAYTVRNIEVYTSPFHSQDIDSSKLDLVERDTVGDYFFNFLKGIKIRKEILLGRIYILPGTRYNVGDVEQTVFSLSELSQVSIAKVNFVKVGEGLLDCNIILNLAPQQSYAVDLEGTNSSGNIGGGVKLAYQHRNIFGGSEHSSTTLSVSREARTIKGDLSGEYATEFGVATELEYPEFLLPIWGKKLRRKIKSKTVFELAYDWQSRPDYRRTVINASYGYRWRKNPLWRHQYKMIDLNYVNIHDISPAFQENISDSYLLYSYQDHLISAGSYTLTFNNQAAKRYKNSTFFRTRVETAGNALFGLSALLDNEQVNGSYKVGDIPFAQYIKFDVNYAYNKYINKSNNIAFRLGAGCAVPYGNMNVVPFERRYFSGGANDVRGWQVRSLGPGSYHSPEFNYYNQTGDIQLQANVEYRFDLVSLLEGAVFCDAGNVWTLKAYEEQPGGKFIFSDFYKEVALAYGAGLRFDFDYIILRFDFGFKLFDPSREESDKWRVKSFNYDKDVAFHFAIGYPF